MDGAHLEPQTVDEFVRQLTIPPTPGAVTGWQPAACGGGVPQCSSFTAAETAAHDEMTRFLTGVTQGFQAYKGIATACRDDYLNRDLTSAQQISHARDHVSQKG